MQRKGARYFAGNQERTIEIKKKKLSQCFEPEQIVEWRKALLDKNFYTKVKKELDIVRRQLHATSLGCQLSAAYIRDLDPERGQSELRK
jgi:hypothetical protein